MATPTNGRRSERRGNYSLLMGLLVWIVVGFAAFSVDIALITMAELQAQATADAASHAALVAFRENLSVAEGNQAANFIMAVDKVAMGTAVIEPGYPQYGEYDFDLRTFSPGLGVGGSANAVRVQVSRQGGNSVQMLLAPMYPINYEEHDVIASAITAQQMRAIEIVVDMSCSMMPSGSTEVATSAVNISRVANLGFLDYLVARPQEGDMMGLTMFAQLASTAPSSTVKTGGNSNSGTSVPWQPLVEIETQQTAIRSRINGICNTQRTTQTVTTLCPAGWHPTTATIGSCTNPEPALKQAIHQLKTYTDDTYFRGLIFFSDGVPNCNGSGGGTDAISRAYAQATAAWNEDIHIWSILYHNGSFDPSFMNNMVRGIGFSQTSPNAADLPAMYQEVAKSLPTALVE